MIAHDAALYVILQIALNRAGEIVNTERNLQCLTMQGSRPAQVVTVKGQHALKTACKYCKDFLSRSQDSGNSNKHVVPITYVYSCMSHAC